MGQIRIKVLFFGNALVPTGSTMAHIHLILPQKLTSK